MIYTYTVHIYIYIHYVYIMYIQIYISYYMIVYIDVSQHVSPMFPLKKEPAPSGLPGVPAPP